VIIKCQKQNATNVADHGIRGFRIQKDVFIADLGTGINQKRNEDGGNDE
jgi:hypothetical protein